MADPVSIIGTILQLLDTAKKCYEKVQGARRLRQAFHEIYDQIGLVKATFEQIKECYRDNDDRRKIADVLEQCEQYTRSLMEIYVLVSENAEKPWAARYADYIKSMAKDRKGKVEELWARILEGIHVLQGFHVFSGLATRDQLEQALLKIETVENSLSDSNTGGDNYYAPVASTHSGSGVNNSQNQLNTGPGIQFMGGTHNHAALDTSGGRLEFTGIYSDIARSPVRTYVERPELQKQMKEALHDTVEQRNNGNAKILIVCGLGGAGKSQLTLNYIDRYQDDYTAVFWIDAGNKALLEADYKQIRNSLYSAKRTDMDLKACVFEVRQWCRQMEGRWLFVYDSADEIDGSQDATHINLREVLVNTPNSDIIITTRSQSAKEMTDLEAVQVGDMTLFEARELFVRRSKLSITSDGVQEQVDNIVRELGYFALALNLAGAYVAETPRLRKDLGEYLSEYRERRKSVLRREPKVHVDQYGASVLTTWETSYDAISARLPEAGKLLSFLAFLGPDDLFPELFEAKDKSAIDMHASWLSVDSTTTSIQEVLDSSFTMLRGYSLVLWRDEQDSYSMHKLVHDWSYERLDDESQAAFCDIVLDFLVYTGRERISEPGFKARLVSHAMACFERSRECCKSNCASRAIVLRGLPGLARFLTAVGGYRLACDVWFFLHECCLQDDCANSALYFTAVQSLVANMDPQSRCTEARDILQPALDKARALYGSKNSLTCILVGALGEICVAEGKFMEAKRLIGLAVDGLVGLARLHAITGLARVCMYQGDFAEAERLSRQVCIRLEGICGPMDQYTLIAMTDLGLIPSCTGEHSEADAVLRQALHRCQVTFGLRHFDTLTRALFCGFVAMNLKKCDEGVGLMKQVLADAASVGITEHKMVLDRVPQLGRIATAQGAYNEALNLYRMAYKAYAATLGPRNSNTLNCMAHCGSLAIWLHRYEEGERLLRQAMSETEMVEGMHHKRALRCVFELGHAARKQGSYDKALVLFQKAYDGCFAALGVDDEYTLICHEELSAVRQFVQRRTDLLHSSEKASTRFAELLRANRHLQTPSQGRGRAYTDPGPGKTVEWYLGTDYEERSDTRSIR